MKEQVNVTSVEQLKTLLENAKCGGQYITVNVMKAAEMNVFPTDGSEKVRRNPDVKIYEQYGVQAHYTEDYEKAMAKALGINEYEAHDENRVHIVKNALMQFKSTGNVCFIYLPTKYLGYRLVDENGNALSAKEIAYYMRYKKPKSTSGVIEYRNIGIANIVSIAIDNKVYVLDIPEDSYLIPKEKKVAKAA